MESPVSDWSRLFDSLDFELPSAPAILEEVPDVYHFQPMTEYSGESPDNATAVALANSYNRSSLISLQGPYASPERNIFLRMQQLDEEESKSQRLPLFKKVPSPDHLRLSQKDCVWLEYFYHLALSWDNYSIPRFVPGLLSRMYSLSLNHFALRQALMSQAAGYYAILHASSLEQSRRFVAQLLPDVQQAISNLTFDEGHICAVFQLIKIYAQFGDLMGAHRHLQGLRLMIDHLIATSQGDPHPLVMCIYRGAVNFDIWFAFEGIPFALPSPGRKDDGVHRKWLQDFIPSWQKSLTEFVLAQFELDDLEHRVMTLLQFRQSFEYSPNIDEPRFQSSGQGILKDLEEWMRRPIIEKCEREEINGRKGVSTAGHGTFLHYPPLIFRNEKYALLLISYHSLVILTTMLTNPEIGPQPYVRFTSAITLCRILAFNMQRSRKEGRPDAVHWHTHDLMRVGLALGEPMYPLEFGWIIERLREKKFRVAHHIADTLIALWRSDSRTVYVQMTESLRSQIDEVQTVALEEDGYQEDL